MEQTATNPQTGEKIVFRGGQWQPLNGGAPRGGPIVGPAAPVKPREAPSGYDFVDGGLAPIPGGPADKPESNPNGPKLPAGYMWKDGVVGGEAVRIKGVSAPKGSAEASAEGQQQLTRSLLVGAGIDLEKGIDPVSDIIRKSTSGTLQRVGAEAYGAVTGDATSGMENIQRLRSIANDMVLQLSGGSLGAQISNSDRDFIAARMGDIANPDVPADQRLAAWDQVKQRFGNIIGVKVGQPSQAADAELAAKYPDAAKFHYSKGELVGYEDKDGEFVILFDAKAPQTTEGGPDLGQALYAGVGDVAEGVGDVLGLVGNPLNAGINAVAGTNLSTDLGQTFRDATGAPDGNALASAINKGGVSALTGVGLGTMAARQGGGVVANALASQPVQQVAGGVSAGASAEGARQMGAPAPVQAIAGLAGGVGGFTGSNALLRAGQPSVASPVAQAANRQGIQMLPADVGGATTRRLTSAAAQAPLSAPPIVQAAERANTQFGQATQRASGGGRLEPDEAGAIVREAGDRFTKESRATGGRLYDRAEKLAQGVSIKAKGALSVIDEQIAELSQAKEVNAPLINVLQTFKADLAKSGGVKVSGMRDLRSAAQKGAYSEDLRSTPAQRVLGIVSNAIGDDISTGLQAAGRGNAAQAFKTADAYWRDRVEYIDKVLEPVIGKGKSGEAVLQSVEQMAAGKGKGVQTLMKLMRSVDKEELSDIQATVIDRMGRSTAGQQNADGTAYSASTFLTNWNKMSSKGKTALFPDQNVRKNLDELATIADSMKQASRYANNSNTAGGITGQVMLSGGLGAISLPAFLAGSGAQFLTGKLLASPRFTQWLAKVPANPQAQQAYAKRLDAIASAEPIIANDIASVKQFLANAPSSSRAAATEGNDVGEERPVKP